MIITTSATIAGKEVRQTLGIVRGNTIRARHLGRAGAYNSFGNGSAMRVSAVGWAFESLDDVLLQARNSAEVTHNHPEGRSVSWLSAYW